jgi:hypothetical protein
VTWELDDIEADGPEAAASQALAILQSDPPIAAAFMVRGADGTLYSVDLTPRDE